MNTRTWCTRSVLVALSALLLFATASGAVEPIGLFVAGGEGGRRALSRDGTTWEHPQNESGAANDADAVLLDVVFGDGKFIAVGGALGGGRLWSTRDGRNWKSLATTQRQVGTIAFGDGKFVAAHGGELLCSTDGETFQSGATLPIDGTARAHAAAFGDTEAGRAFVFIGNAELSGGARQVHWRAVSFDGLTWAAASIDTAPAADIASGSGHFVVVGSDGLIESSHDGQTWQKRAENPGREFTRVVWTGTRFIASAAERGWTSRDGLTWARELDGLPAEVVWSREGLMHLGFSRNGRIFTSRDLRHWKEAVVPIGKRLRSVAFAEIAAPR